MFRKRIMLACVAALCMASFQVVSRAQQTRVPTSASQHNSGKASAHSATPSSITFDPIAIYYSGGSEAGYVVVADVNGDGIADLIVANSYFSDTIGVLLGNRDGTFGPATTYSSGGGGPVAILPVDVNGDGHLDLIIFNQTPCYACSGDGVIAILFGRGEGTFGTLTTYDSGGYAFGGAGAIAYQDVNGDGKPDIVVLNCAPSGATSCTGDAVLSVFLGKGDGKFHSALNSDAGPSAGSGIVLADVNRDGKPDAIFGISGCESSMACPPGALGVLLGNGDGTFGPSRATYPSNGYAANGLAAGDLNGDGIADFVLAGCGLTNCWAGDGVVSVFLGNPDGTFQSGVPYDTGGALGDNVALADINQDGILDIVVANTLGDSVGILLGNGDGTFQKPLTYPTFEGYMYGVAVHDFNGDGKQDIVVSGLAGGGAGQVGVLLNNSGSLVTTTTTRLTSSPNPSTLGQAVTFIATVSSSTGAPPNGEVITFYNGASVLGTSPLNGGSASLSVSSLAVGFHTITAKYPGDSTFGSSTTSPLVQVVATTTSLSSSLNPSIYGQKVTLTATVSNGGVASTPSGKVRFMWNNVALGTPPLGASGVATLTLPTMNADLYPLVAVYEGDSSNPGSSSPVLTQIVNQATSSATLKSSANPSSAGNAVTFTAKITSSTTLPKGLVTFTAGTSVLGTVELTDGKAELTTSSLAAGSTRVTATFAGDSDIKHSSASVMQVVQ